jgi:soluble epoxide hydrolase/lipid-phosphate phosphatase
LIPDTVEPIAEDLLHIVAILGLLTRSFDDQQRDANAPFSVNWYRQRRTNWEEDQALLNKKTIKQPVLFIQATYDSVLKPEMSKSMDALIPNLTRGEVAATHWALTQKPEEVNRTLRQWLEGQGVGKAKSSL